MVLLSELIRLLGYAQVRGPADIALTGISCHSKKVAAGNLFVAIPGFSADGREYVPEAEAAGAAAVVFEGKFFDNLRATQIRVSGARLALAQLSAAWFKNPTDGLYLAGVTGTNGKTTLTYLLEAMWQGAAKKTGVVGTVNARYGSIIREAGQTTPESRDLQEIFFEMKNAGVTHAAIEASSHAIIQERVTGCAFDACVFTNLTQDHLDFHGTMEDYYLSKEKLFARHLKASSKKNRVAVIGVDDEYGKRLAKIEGVPVLTYGKGKEAALHPEQVKVGLDGIYGEISCDGTRIELESPLFGRFNLLNILAAAGVGLHSGLLANEVAEGIKKCRAIPGRLERIEDPKGRLIFVDYAHTPDALKNVLTALRETGRKIVTVFGCGGDRDRTKRPLMGFEAGNLSDVCVVTSDNPRTENPREIIDEILPGVKQTGKKFIVEEDRKKGIEKALELAGSGDVVLIAGKGHEDYQIIGKAKHHFSDQEIVRELMVC
ncbi:MAG: UDP-N-acetylmuramoyl-L-alanyl-D-glutamate--2,6-diaminopimelate ligase [Deltaproteobacteria bacterium]|nr:UDP-N-acetylmuramoyl-L-alanyl-D-glutamate--2,6-diaminopimelate ligase [Deltaproteobacteria bacterium]